MVTGKAPSLLSYVDTPILVADPDGSAVYANPTFEARFALPQGGAQGLPLAILFEAGGREEVRGRLLKRYRDRMGDLGGIPRLSLGLSDVMKFNLPAHAGFMLSLIDGDTSIGDIVSLSGMDSFGALRVLNGLIEAGIVSLGTAERKERRSERVE